MKNNEITLSFKPIHVVKRLIKVLPKRASNVLEARYGVGSSSEKQTLESIGKNFGITRERVRQIEEHALNLIRASKDLKAEHEFFEELKMAMEEMGSVIAEDDLLEILAKDEKNKNAIHLMLVIGDAFNKAKEDQNFKTRWYIDKELAEKIHTSLHKMYEELKDEEIIPEGEFVENFLSYVENVSEHYRNEEIIKRWLNLSKKIDKNPLGEWGKSESSNVSVKGIRDYAYLILRKHGSPIHFKDVANAITKTFNKKAHVATCHNELIRDKRFVLVGRGLYALKEWGYSNGVVKDVIKDVLKSNGPLTKKEIVEKVLKERYVKENTIMVNLQDTKIFDKTSDGKYSIKK